MGEASERSEYTRKEENYGNISRSSEQEEKSCGLRREEMAEEILQFFSLLHSLTLPSSSLSSL
jgi:hypothetical protein